MTDVTIEQEEVLEKPITVYHILKYSDGYSLNSSATVRVSEFSPYHSSRRIDIFAWNEDTMWGYEIKINRSDFLGDKKWEEYLQYCTYFYFIAPRGVIRREEIPENIGLIEVGWKKSWNNESYLRHEVVKKPKKLPEVSEENIKKIHLGIIYKLAYNKNILEAHL